jgi:hypothetical protein
MCVLLIAVVRSHIILLSRVSRGGLESRPPIITFINLIIKNNLNGVIFNFSVGITQRASVISVTLI